MRWNQKTRKQHSKFMTLILRHEALAFGLKPDEHGYVSIDEVLRVMQEDGRVIKYEDIFEIAGLDAKGRFEIVGDKIRARYGHSLKVQPMVKAAQPPEVLYHGTAGRNVNAIMKEGLKPMSREYVHLSSTVRDANAVARRHANNIVIFRVKAEDAWCSGVEFFSEASVYLSRHIPPEFVEVMETPA